MKKGWQLVFLGGVWYFSVEGARALFFGLDHVLVNGWTLYGLGVVLACVATKAWTLLGDKEEKRPS